MNRPKVFISYSWDSEEHKEWVLQLANDLISKYGVEVLLDQYELTAGKDLMYFLESSLEKASKVLLILTPNYKIKSENRKGGVGVEYSMISQELFDLQANNDKFIPILRTGNINQSSPKYIKSKIYFEMFDDSKYIIKINELSRLLYNKPKLEMPKLGAIPDFKDENFDPIIELANELSNKEKINNEIDRVLDSKEGVDLANSEVNKLFDSLKKKANLYNSKTDFSFGVTSQDRRELLLNCLYFSVQIYWKQAYSNTLDNSVLKLYYIDNHIRTRNRFNEDSKIVASEIFRFDLTTSKTNIWKTEDDSLFTSDDIIKKSFSFILEQIQKEKSKNFREN